MEGDVVKSPQKAKQQAFLIWVDCYDWKDWGGSTGVNTQSLIHNTWYESQNLILINDLASHVTGLGIREDGRLGILV